MKCAEACYASMGKRFIDYIVDPLIYTLPIAILFMWLIDVYPALNTQLPIFKMLPRELREAYSTITYGSMMENSITTVISFLYFFFLEAFWHGRTISKQMCRTEVVDINGNRPEAWRILVRTLCRLIPFDNFSFLFGGRWYDGKLHGSWHDKISGTYVVDSVLLEQWKQGSFDGSNRLGAMLSEIVKEAQEQAAEENADDQDQPQNRPQDEYDEDGNRRLRVEDLYPQDDDQSNPDEQ